MSVPVAAIQSGRYDQAERKRSKRHQRERGCWVYISQAELLAAGIDPADPPPYYRTRGHQRSRNAHAVMVDLYREA